MQDKGRRFQFRFVGCRPTRHMQHIFSVFKWTGLGLLLTFLLLGTAAAQQFPDTVDKPWHISADEMGYDQVNDRIIGRGNVVLSKHQRKISADMIAFNYREATAVAEGNVKIEIDDDVISGDRMTLDLKSDTGTLTSGDIFFKNRNVHLRGDKIEKTGPDTYTVDCGSITICDGQPPAWKVTGRDVRVTIEGYGTAWHALLWIWRIPVFYSPFFVFPVKRDRQSGLLTPEGAISERNGLEINQPFYWAINESSDATFYLHHLEERGEKVGAEYRYRLDAESKGTVMFDYLDDRQVDDGTGDNSEKWGFAHDSYLRPNRDRYWLRAKVDQHNLPLGFNAKLDLDFVSDQDYLLEFKSGYSGFNVSDAYFLKQFGRDLADYNRTVRTNRLSVSQSWSPYSLSIYTDWYDNVILRRQGEEDTTVHLLPWIIFRGAKQKLGPTPAYADFFSEYVHFYRQDGTESAPDLSTHRMELYPRLFLPIKVFNWVTLEPAAGWRHTFWQISDYEEGFDQEDTFFHRQIYDLQTTLNSEIYRVFKVGGETIDKIRHAIRPRVFYRFIPEVDQDEFPSKTSTDRIAKQDSVTLELINTLTSKLKSPKAAEGPFARARKVDDPYDYRYQEFLRLLLRQSYDFNVAKDDTIAERQPWTELYAELRVTPTKNLYFRLDGRWDPYSDRVTQRNAQAILKDSRGDSLNVRYRNKLEQSEYLDIHLAVKITDEFTGYLDFERDIFNAEDVALGWGLAYASQCWSVSFNFREEFEAQRYSFTVNLYGLGGFEQGLASSAADQ